MVSHGSMVLKRNTHIRKTLFIFKCHQHTLSKLNTQRHTHTHTYTYKKLNKWNNSGAQINWDQLFNEYSFLTTN